MVSAAGVNVAVRLRPEPLIAPKVPPVTVIPPAVPSHKKEAPGSSLNVKVIVAVSPTFNVDTSLVIATVGAVVSMVTRTTLEG